MTAYAVTDTGSDEGSAVIVFADSSPGAKKLTLSALDDSEWINLRCRRAPDADKYFAQFGPGVVDWDSTDGLRMYRDIEWQLADARSCDCCDRFESERIPESLLVDADGDLLCKDCSPAGCNEGVTADHFADVTKMVGGE